MKRLLPICVITCTACFDIAPEITVPPPVPILEWAASVDTLPGTYTRVMRPAEFWDSVLVVPDVSERLLWRIDLTTGAREQLGTRGGGPGEYGRVGWAAKVHRDSVAILQGFYWTPFPVISVATGRGRTVSLRQAAAESDTRAYLQSVAQPYLYASDTLGHVYGEAQVRALEIDSASKRPVPGSGGLRDTVTWIRYALGTGASDTLGENLVGVKYVSGGRDATGARTSSMSLGPYGPYNLWTPLPDGRLLVVDAATYRVRLTDRASSPAADFAVPFASVAVSKAGWDGYVQTTTKGSIALIEKTMSDVSAQIGKSMPSSAAPRYIVPEMPRTLPPVNAGGGIRPPFAFGDVVWVPVHRVDPPDAEYWDVIDVVRGERVATVEFPANHRLVLVSGLGAYVVAKDDDDVERVLLYRAAGVRSTP